MFTSFIHGALTTWGPIAVFLLLVASGVGVHLSEDAIIVPAGVLAGEGQLPLYWTILASVFGVLGGDMLWFFFCNRYGGRLVRTRWFKKMVHPRRLLEYKWRMERHGMRVIAISRFIPGARTPAITIAGLLQFSYWRFLLVDGGLILVTAPLQFMAGYLIAKGLADKGTEKWVLSGLAIVALSLAVILIIIGWVRYHRKGVLPHKPRAQAAWLHSFGRSRASKALTSA